MRMKYIFVTLYHHRIGSISLSYCCYIFYACVARLVVPLYYAFVLNMSREDLDIVYVAAQSVMCANNRVHYYLQVVFVSLNITLIFIIT